MPLIKHITCNHPPLIYRFSSGLIATLHLNVSPTSKCSVVLFSVVCVGVLSVCSGSDFSKPWPRNFIFGTQLRRQNIKIQFVHKCHGGQGHGHRKACMSCLCRNCRMPRPINFISGSQVQHHDM